MWLGVMTFASVLIFGTAFVLLLVHRWHARELARDIDEAKRWDITDDTVTFALPAAGPLDPQVYEIAKRNPSDTVVLRFEGDSGALSDDTQIVSLGEVVEAAVRATAAVDDSVRLVAVQDELGVWEPWNHESEEAQIMGDVLAWRKWSTIRPKHVGLSS